MKSLCKQKIKISISQLDLNARVGVTQALSIFQDNMCEFYKKINCDGMSLIERCQAFWVLLKTKIVFHKQVNWLDVCRVKTDVYKLTNVRMDLCNALFDKNNELAISCIQEVCGVDWQTRKLRTIDSIQQFPKDINVIKPFDEMSFEKMTFELCESDFVMEVKIGVDSIDYFGHTNNVAYAKILYSTFDYEFIKNTSPLEFEIIYIKESSLGDILKVYKRVEGNTIYFELKRNDVAITKSILKYIETDKN